LKGVPTGNLRIVYNQDFTGGDGKDQFGHGTHVAGVIAGNGQESTGGNGIYTFRGLAPNVKLVNLKVLDAQGRGTIAAINWAIEVKATYNIRVINLSLGRPVTRACSQDPLCQAVGAAWNAGIVVVEKVLRWSALVVEATPSTL
jgi:serine protease AprX